MFGERAYLATSKKSESRAGNGRGSRPLRSTGCVAIPPRPESFKPKLYKYSANSTDCIGLGAFATGAPGRFLAKTATRLYFCSKWNRCAEAVRYSICRIKGAKIFNNWQLHGLPQSAGLKR